MEATLHALFSTLPCVVCLLWTVLLFDEARCRRVGALRILTAFALTCSVLYFCHALFFNGEETPLVRTLYRGANLAVYPLFWLYIRALSESAPLPLRACWVLLPALAGVLLSAIAFACGADTDFADLPLRAIFLVEVIWVCIAGIRRLNAYEHQVVNYYADTEGKSLAPIRNLLVLFVLISAFSALVNFLGRSLFTPTLLLIIPSVLFSALLFSIFFAGRRIEYTAGEVSGPEELPSGEADAASEEMQELILRIDALMENRQLFRTPGLKITDLATELGTNRTYVSNCINRMKGQSFSDFVNAYRVRYAQHQMRWNDSGKTIAQIGAEAGFTGETSFFRNFKKVTGQTPREWLTAQGKQD